MSDEQLAFDIEGMLHEAAVAASPEWHGAPLHFTTAYFSPAELDAALEHWQFLHQHDGSPSRNRMWHRAITVPGGLDSGEHAFDFFTADLRCEPWDHVERHKVERHKDCLCVGDLSYLAVCAPHEWHVITSDENTAVEGWHDHAFPGWRNLPVIPIRLRDAEKVGHSQRARKWIEDHYPRSMQVHGAPVITERRPYGTRHVPGRSPWGGYDLAHTAVDPDRIVEGAKPPKVIDFPPGPPRPHPSAGMSLGD